MRMYRYALPSGSVNRKQKMEFTEVEVEKGRKYFTCTKGYREKFFATPSSDVNGNPVFEQKTEYGHDYVLYETEEAALMRQKRDRLLSEILDMGVHMLVHRMDAIALEQIKTLCEETKNKK